MIHCQCQYSSTDGTVNGLVRWELVRTFIEYSDQKVSIIQKFCLVNKTQVVKTDAKLVRYVRLVWEVRLKNVVNVSFDAVEEVVFGVE